MIRAAIVPAVPVLLLGEDFFGVVEGVGSGLSGVEVRRWYPFGLAA
jgi:hypothetical protein